MDCPYHIDRQVLEDNGSCIRRILYRNGLVQVVGKRKVTPHVRHGHFDRQPDNDLCLCFGCAFQPYCTIQNGIDSLALYAL